jgi:hypothetical protein
VVPIRRDVSEAFIASIIWVTKIGGLGTRLAVTRNRNTQRKFLWLLVAADVVPISLILSTLMIGVTSSSKTSVLQEPNGLIFQKTAFLTVTALKT